MSLLSRPLPLYMASRSTLSLRALIFELRSDASLEVRETAITALDTPHARPCSAVRMCAAEGEAHLSDSATAELQRLEFQGAPTRATLLGTYCKKRTLVSELP